MTEKIKADPVPKMLNRPMQHRKIRLAAKCIRCNHNGNELHSYAHTQAPNVRRRRYQKDYKRTAWSLRVGLSGVNLKALPHIEVNSAR